LGKGILHNEQFSWHATKAMADFLCTPLLQGKLMLQQCCRMTTCHKAALFGSKSLLWKLFFHILTPFE